MNQIEITDSSRFKEIVSEETDSVIMDESEDLFKTKAGTLESDSEDISDNEDPDQLKGKFSRSENDKINIGRYKTFFPNEKRIPRIFIGPDCNSILIKGLLVFVSF